MVVRVWGKADRFDLVFAPTGDDRWIASVPADMQDGQYAVELYCEDDSGNRAYWTGMLYLCNADAVKMRIIADKYKIWLKADNDPELQGDPLALYMQDEAESVKPCDSFMGGGGELSCCVVTLSWVSVNTSSLPLHPATMSLSLSQTPDTH